MTCPVEKTPGCDVVFYEQKEICAQASYQFVEIVDVYRQPREVQQNNPMTS